MTLKLIKGGFPEDPADGRARNSRRTVRRRTPARDPFIEILERLDEEPADDRPKIPGQRRSGGPMEPPEPRRRPSRPTAALLLVLLAALTATAYHGLGWYGDRQTHRVQRQAVAAAKQSTVDFVSVSASSVDRDLARILAATTGDFRDGFSRGRSHMRAAVVGNNTESRGTVLRAALLWGDRRRAVVPVAIDATVRNTHAPEGRRAQYRIQVELIRTDGRWLVSGLRFVE